MKILKYIDSMSLNASKTPSDEMQSATMTEY